MIAPSSLGVIEQGGPYEASIDGCATPLLLTRADEVIE